MHMWRLQWKQMPEVIFCWCGITISGLWDVPPHLQGQSWWRHQMETFSALLAICAGNSPVPGEFPAQRPVTRGFDVFFDLHPNKRLSKQWWGWWFETPSFPLWRHRNVMTKFWSHINTGPIRGGLGPCTVLHHENSLERHQMIWDQMMNWRYI